MKNKSNHLYGVSTNIITMVSPIIVIPFIIGSVGLESYGGFVQLNIIYSCLVSIFVASLTGYFIKNYIENKLSIFDIIIVQSIVCFLSAGIMSFFVLNTNLGFYSYFFCFALLSNCFNCEWYFHATGSQKKLFYRTFSIKVIFIITTITTFSFNDHIKYYFIIYSLNIILMNLISFSFCFNVSKEEFFNKVSKHFVIKKTLLDAKYFILNPSIGAVYQYGDQILVGMLFSKSSLVFVNIAKQIIGAAVMVSGTLCRVEQKNIFSLPVNERINRIKRIFILFIFYLIISSLIIAICGPVFLKYLISEAVNLDFWYYMLISGVFIFTSLSIFMDSILGLAFRKEYFTLVANIACAVVVTLLNLFFLKKYGANFSLVALLCGEAIVFLMLLAMHRKSLNKVNPL